MTKTVLNVFRFKHSMLNSSGLVAALFSAALLGQPTAWAQSALGASSATSAPSTPSAISGLSEPSASVSAPSPKVMAKKRNAKASTNAATKGFMASPSLSELAARELVVSDEARSSQILPTPATVRSAIARVSPPVRGFPFRLGLGLQPFQPDGSMPVAEMQPYDLAGLGVRPMLSLEAQWLPLNIDGLGDTSFGLFGSFGYARHTMSLRSPIGAELENSQLQSVKIQGGIAAARRLAGVREWSVHGSMGWGQLQTVQSSTSSFANQAFGISFVSAGVGFERSLSKRVSLYGGYELRSALRSGELGVGVSMHNVLLSMMGNFR